MTREERRERKAASERRFAEALRALGREPDAVIDIGVRQGTPWLYEVFADAPFLLVDPQEGGESLLTARPSSFVFVNKAAGRAPGRLTLNEQGAMSTFLARTELTHVPTRRTYEVEVVTLDDLIDLHLPDARRIGLKIDTEGFEIEVLAGLVRRLDRIDFIVSEASVLNRFEGSYNFSELVAALWDKGLRFYNFLGEPGLRAPRVHDCIFLPARDPAFDRK
jgi:FkbM family methyltransferase